MTTNQALNLIVYDPMNDTMREVYISDLPRLAADDEIVFECGPGIACFNRCCGDLDLLLSPYDVMRLRVALRLDGRAFIERFCAVEQLPGIGFPVIRLNMRPDKTQSCPFVRQEGCSVYRHRPGACRAYPLGREASADEQGNIVEEYLLVREPHCEGFQVNTRPTRTADFLSSQGLNEYIPYDDRYIRLMFRWERRGEPLDGPRFEQIRDAVYLPDTLPGSVDIEKHFATQNDDERLALETARLSYGFDWIERVLFEEAP